MHAQNTRTGPPRKRPAPADRLKERKMNDSPRLAELMASRILHDLGSPMASITAILPQAADAAAHAILVQTADEMRARLRLFAAAFGSGDALGWEDLGPLLQGAPMAHRVRFELPRNGGALSPGRVRLLLSLALLAAEALPRGGVVSLSADSVGRVAVLPEGRDAIWSPTLIDLLAGGTLEAALAEGPRRILAPWVIVQAEAEGTELSLALAAGMGLPPLMVTPGG